MTCRPDVRFRHAAAWRGGRGFTLIELITVVVILGVLAAVALPKFLDLKSNAQVAAFQGQLADARSKINMVFAKAMLLGPGGSSTSNGCTSTLDVNGNGTVCLDRQPVYTVGFNMSCHTGIGQATYFKGPYTTGQNATVYYHTAGDVAGGTNWWVDWASGCAFTCVAGNGASQLTSMTVTTAACQ